VIRAPHGMTWFYFAVWSVIRLLSRLLFRIESRGTENLPATGPVLLASNHASNLDPPLVAICLKRPIHFLAKEELFRVPVLGPVITRLNAHPIRREGIDRKALRGVLEVLRSGQTLIIFPEGTRTPDGSLQEAKPGVAMIAAQAGAPIVPVYIEGTFRAMPRGASWPRPVKVRVYFGEPFPPGLPDDVNGQTAQRDRYDRLARQIMEHIKTTAPERVVASGA
jgi:1-acyl-sn-glycerol-3-phosphate acyltransferase